MNYKSITLPPREPEVFEWEIIWPEKETVLPKRFKKNEVMICEAEVLKSKNNWLDSFFFVFLKQYSPIRLLACFVSFLFPYEISEENKLSDYTLDHFGKLIEQKNKGVITKEDLRILANI